MYVYQAHALQQAHYSVTLGYVRLTATVRIRLVCVYVYIHRCTCMQGIKVTRDTRVQCQKGAGIQVSLCARTHILTRAHITYKHMVAQVARDPAHIGSSALSAAERLGVPPIRECTLVVAPED
jgi:hypothetical protein